MVEGIEVLHRAEPTDEGVDRTFRLRLHDCLEGLVDEPRVLLRGALNQLLALDRFKILELYIELSDLLTELFL